MSDVMAISSSCCQAFFNPCKHHPMRVTFVNDWVTFVFLCFISSCSTDSECYNIRTLKGVGVDITAKDDLYHDSGFAKPPVGIFHCSNSWEERTFRENETEKQDNSTVVLPVKMERQHCSQHLTDLILFKLLHTLFLLYGNMHYLNCFCDARLLTISAEWGWRMERSASPVSIREQLSNISNNPQKSQQILCFEILRRCGQKLPF